MGRKSGQAKTPIRILHLSDLHLCEERRWAFDPLLRKLTKAIARLEDENLGPDVVAITGDIADTGVKKDYDIAAEWIDGHLCPALPKGVSKKRVFIVPGNHDVDRARVRPSVKYLQDGLLKDADQDKIEQMFTDAQDRANFLDRHKAYLKFAKNYGAGTPKLNVPWWSKTLSLADQRIRFVGLCSSWMAWSEEDYGRLLVGRWQINQVLEGDTNADWTVVLVHHPWWWLAEFDATEVEASLQREAHIVLHGHLHRQTVRAARYPQDGLELAAGSVFNGTKYSNAFQLIELHRQDRKIGLHQRLWHEGDWITNRHVRNAAPNGEVCFRLNPWGPLIGDAPEKNVDSI